MSVADVRRALGQMRKRWEEHSPENPMYPSDPLFNGMSMENFSLKFVLGHHKKRHEKSSDRVGKETEEAHDSDA